MLQHTAVLVAARARAGEALGARGESHLGAGRAHHANALLAHVLRHEHERATPHLARGQRERDPGVARGRLDHGVARAQFAAPHGLGQHEHRDAVLHAATGIGALHLDLHTVHLDEGSTSDTFDESEIHCALPCPEGLTFAAAPRLREGRESHTLRRGPRDRHP
jgi:hypothetical protein